MEIPVLKDNNDKIQIWQYTHVYYRIGNKQSCEREVREYNADRAGAIVVREQLYNELGL